MIGELLRRPPRPVNVGLHAFAESMAAEGLDVVEVAWPPAPDVRSRRESPAR